MAWSVVAHASVFGLDPRRIEYALAFLRSYLLGGLFHLLFSVVQGYRIAQQRTRTLLIVVLAANVVNGVGDYVLIFGDRRLERIGLPGLGVPALGPFGAGLSTTFAILTMPTRRRCRRSSAS